MKINVLCNNLNCPNIVEIYPYQIKRDKCHFCSGKCQGKWRSKNLTGKNHYNYGKHYNRIPFEVKEITLPLIYIIGVFMGDGDD